MLRTFFSGLKQKLTNLLSPTNETEIIPSKIETALERNKRVKEELLEELRNGTFRVCTQELSRIQAPKKMDSELKRIIKESGLSKK